MISASPEARVLILEAPVGECRWRRIAKPTLYKCSGSDYKHSTVRGRSLVRAATIHDIQPMKEMSILNIGRFTYKQTNKHSFRSGALIKCLHYVRMLALNNFNINQIQPNEIINTGHPPSGRKVIKKSHRDEEINKLEISESRSTLDPSPGSSHGSVFFKIPIDVLQPLLCTR